jgi:hypothetical protein
VLAAALRSPEVSRVLEGGGAARDGQSGPATEDSRSVPPVVDAAIAVGLIATEVAARSVTIGFELVRPFATLILRPPVLPERYWPQRGLDQLADRGERARRQTVRQAWALLDNIVPFVVDAILDRIDLTQIVIDRVKVMRIVDEVDIAGIVGHLDFDSIIESVPIDHILELVDIDGIVARVNLDQIMARVDVNAIVSTVDIQAIISRVDLGSIVTQVIDEIDLPEIIWESSGGMASATVVGVRMQGKAADERINRIVDRVLRRRHDRKTGAPVDRSEP